MADEEIAPEELEGEGEEVVDEVRVPSSPAPTPCPLIVSLPNAVVMRTCALRARRWCLG